MNSVATSLDSCLRSCATPLKVVLYWNGHGDGYMEDIDSLPLFLAVLLNLSFRIPNIALTAYITTIANYEPRDDPDYIADNYQTFSFFSPIPFTTLTYMPNLRTWLHFSLMHLLCLTTPPPHFPAKCIDLVTQSYGRFTDSNMTEILVDEPIIYAGASLWFSDSPQSITDPSYFQTNIIDPAMIDRHEFYHAAISEDAVLITRTRNPSGVEEEVFRYSERTHQPLVTPSHSKPDLESWLRGSKGTATPFCLHSIPSGHVLVFALKLLDTDDRRLWVFLSVSKDLSHRIIPLVELQDTFSGLELDKIADLSPDQAQISEVAKLLKALPNLASDLDSTGVLRVTLPFNGQIDLSTLDSENFPGSVAVIDPAILQVSVKSIDQKDIAENVISIIAGIPKMNADDQTRDPKKRKRGTAKKPRKPRAPQPSGTGARSSSKR
ncbi:hypothetical protein Moror_11294 [Moniliophthora roreri MCA 2997]|uniref:Uncharacterized protein n=1 Tax=Moniliophthora roreri (strain MCA 2997) TaxID=1381753 RepID=V2X1S4_MONRO|nr:hypothetical protein Moror_11294 [Moniliophthora roreri MCA 2997]